MKCPSREKAILMMEKVERIINGAGEGKEVR